MLNLKCQFWYLPQRASLAHVGSHLFIHSLFWIALSIQCTGLPRGPGRSTTSFMRYINRYNWKKLIFKFSVKSDFALCMLVYCIAQKKLMCCIHCRRRQFIQKNCSHFVRKKFSLIPLQKWTKLQVYMQKIQILTILRAPAIWNLWVYLEWLEQDCAASIHWSVPKRQASMNSELI